MNSHLEFGSQFTEYSNSVATKIAKPEKRFQRASWFHFWGHAENETSLVSDNYVGPRTQTDFGGIFKIIQILSVIIVQTNGKLNVAEQRNSKQKVLRRKERELDKWQSETS